MLVSNSAAKKFKFCSSFLGLLLFIDMRPLSWQQNDILTHFP